MRKNLRATSSVSDWVQDASRTHTQLHGFLRGCEELGHSRSKLFTVNRIAGAEEMLTDEKGEDVNKMRVKCDLLERQVINCGWLAWTFLADVVYNSREARLASCLSGWNSRLEDSSKCCWTNASERRLDERTLK